MQKKVSSALIVLLLATCSFAQLKKGNKITGLSIGSVFTNNGKTDYSSATSSYSISNDNFGVSIAPSLGWFTSDNLAVGVMPVIGFTSSKLLGKSGSGNTFSKDETTGYHFGIGGFARYYFPGTAKMMRFFGQYNLGVGLAGSQSEGFEYDQLGTYVDRFDVKSSGDLFANTGIVLGLAKFLNAHTSLDFYIGYTYSYTKANVTGASNRDYANPLTPDEQREINEDRKTTNHGLVLGLGFQVFLENKK